MSNRESQASILAEAQLDLFPGAIRGSLIRLRAPLADASDWGVVVSNNIQNDASDFLLIVPLERRSTRLAAPFAVDVGRTEGFRDLHAARCDWVTRVPARDVERIERASIDAALLEQIESALRVALGFRDVI